jgi:dTDP-4-amino-4,6-dideoxygalactose transaminase
MHARRRTIAECYASGLAGVPEIELPAQRSRTDHAWHIYAVRLHLDRLTIDRARFCEELAARNVATSVHFIPVHLLSYYRDKYDLRPDDFPVATREFSRLVSLPIHPRMDAADVDDVVDAVGDVVASFRR